MSAQAPRPLAGVRVLDLSRVLAGPWAGQMLADYGAEVLKVERPGVGDDTRTWGPPWWGEGEARVAAYFVCANRGKRSVAIDIASPEGIQTVRELAREGFVPRNRLLEMERAQAQLAAATAETRGQIGRNQRQEIVLSYARWVLVRTVSVISARAADVSSSEAACSSVRCERSKLPWAIWPLATGTGAAEASARNIGIPAP